MSAKACRLCRSSLKYTFVDLGSMPSANAFLTENLLAQPEAFYPLHAYVCHTCLLVQLEEFESPAALFSDYAYFSSYSDSWLKHTKNYVDEVVERFSLGPRSYVIEIASNDGYLLQFVKAKSISVLGIEPAENIAKEAEKKGIPTHVKFFGADTAKEITAGGKQADLLIGNNVLAHVPDLHDFVEGLRIALKPEGVLTMEFPHLLQMLTQNQFDTIYHEHFSYFSFFAIEKIFAQYDLTLFDVQELLTHGGSLRIYVRHKAYASLKINPRIAALKNKEAQAGLDRLDTYLHFNLRIQAIKQVLRNTLIEIKSAGKSIAGYGAPAKGNTLLNYCKIGTDFIDYTVDRNPYKQGKYLPGSHIPIYDPSRIYETRPDYLLILPWNLEREITEQMSGIRAWGGQFVVPILKTRVLA